MSKLVWSTSSVLVLFSLCFNNSCLYFHIKHETKRRRFSLFILWIANKMSAGWKREIVGDFFFLFLTEKFSSCFWSLGYRRWKKANHYCCDIFFFYFWLLKKFATILVGICNLNWDTFFSWVNNCRVNLDDKFTS